MPNNFVSCDDINMHYQINAYSSDLPPLSPPRLSRSDGMYVREYVSIKSIRKTAKRLAIVHRMDHENNRIRRRLFVTNTTLRI